ncbi:hypothetical protein GE09DRAFT_1223581 [Coniochaeta sp. 2T2.1]|nr:hypothetical protein GE09DRAFT_1223581 [Coniochaeta sp. 2T2.1]
MPDPKPNIIKALTPGYVGGSQIPNNEPVAKNFFSPSYEHNNPSTHDYGYPPVSNSGGSATGASGSATTGQAQGGDGTHGSGCGCCITA